MYFSFGPPEQKAVGLKQFRATVVRQTIDAFVAQRYRDRVAAVMDATATPSWKPFSTTMAGCGDRTACASSGKPARRGFAWSDNLENPH